MAGSSPKHHMDCMGYCLDNCSGAAVLAFKNFEVTYANLSAPFCVSFTWAPDGCALSQPSATAPCIAAPYSLTLPPALWNAWLIAPTDIRPASVSYTHL